MKHNTYFHNSQHATLHKLVNLLQIMVGVCIILLFVLKLNKTLITNVIIVGICVKVYRGRIMGNLGWWLLQLEERESLGKLVLVKINRDLLRLYSNIMIFQYQQDQFICLMMPISLFIEYKLDLWQIHWKYIN